MLLVCPYEHPPSPIHYSHHTHTLTHIHIHIHIRIHIRTRIHAHIHTHLTTHCLCLALPTLSYSLSSNVMSTISILLVVSVVKVSRFQVSNPHTSHFTNYQLSTHCRTDLQPSPPHYHVFLYNCTLHSAHYQQLGK